MNRIETELKRFFKRFILVLLPTLVIGCVNEPKNEIKREAIQRRYISAQTEMRVQSIVIGGNVSTIPIPHHQDEKYEVQFYIVYDDGSVSKEWIEVTQAEYEAYQNIDE